MIQGLAGPRDACIRAPFAYLMEHPGAATDPETMIRYTLKCEADHVFDSWFQSAEAFERLHGARQVSCAICGSTRVAKTLMAPSVVGPRDSTERSDEGRAGLLATPQTEVEAALAKLRAHVEANSSYVGDEFARQARAMHEGELPERAIHGEARPEEARALLEEGVPVMPLPFASARKTN